MVLMGAGVGVLGSVVVSRLLAALVPGVRQFDGQSIAVADATLTAAADLGCWLPPRRAERVERFVTADGRIIARETGYAVIHAGGVRTVDEVVFAEPGDMTLLGAHTIEGMNLRVDLKAKRLVPAGPLPAAAAA